MSNVIAPAKGQEYSAALQQELYESYVGAFIANNKFEGDFVGNTTVHFPRYNKLTIQDLASSYDKILLDDVVLTDETFTLDKRKAGGYKISDEDYLEMRPSPDSELIISLKDAYANAYDTEIFLEYANAGYTVDDGDMETATNGGAGNAIIASKNNMYDLVTAVVEVMDENNIPNNDRWLVISPKEKRLLSKAPELVRSTAMGDRIVTGGFMGDIDGVKIWFSNNTQTVGGTKHLLAGQGKPICFAANMRPNMTFIDSSTIKDEFVNYVKSMTKFGVKTFHEGAIKLLDVQVSA